jgi:D-alanine-D-alanine ligase-like ATP-grasp enzyme
MKDLDLESGSIDMVFTQDGEFVFLEVNPIGQFGMTSYPCNYFLEKIIAKRIAIDMIA